MKSGISFKLVEGSGLKIVVGIKIWENIIFGNFWWDSKGLINFVKYLRFFVCLF